MKFQLAVNMERIDNSLDMKDVARHTLEMVQIAEDGGFDLVWSAEHHALEMTIAPNPFQLLTWWSSETNRIRLGTAVATHTITDDDNAPTVSIAVDTASAAEARPTACVRSTG